MNRRQSTEGKRIGLYWLFSLMVVIMAAGGAEGALQCYDCHGTRSTQDIRPADRGFRSITTGGFRGNHRDHLAAGAGAAACSACHPGSAGYTSGHRDGNITVSSNMNGSPVATRYGNRTTVWPQVATPTSGSCTNVNCHFEGTTPVWGSATLARTACDVCHGAPPADGAHGKKHGDYYGTDAASCGKCHIDHTTEGDPLSHAKSAGTRPLNVQFTAAPNTGGSYGGTLSYPQYLPSQHPARNGACTNLYCHSDGTGRAPVMGVRWSDTATTKCYSCHRGRAVDNTAADCAAIGGTWNAGKGLCAPYVNMTSNGHSRLVGAQWIRKYPCTYCHNATVAALTDGNGKITGDGGIITAQHVNGAKDVVMAPQWGIVGRPAPSYNAATKVCDNVYCHSDGTTNPDVVKQFAWTEHGTECNTCHGHPRGSCSSAGCHDGRTDGVGKVWTPKTGWPAGDEWKAAIPMFPNQGAGTARANSHTRHTETNFTCDQCHAATIVNGTCTDCHVTGIPTGKMSEVAHLNADYHANKSRDIVFKKGGSYNPLTKSCANTACHTGGTDPVWGGSVNGTVICLNCHGTTGADVDSFGFRIYSTQAKINLTEWVNNGHGRPATSGPYPASGNPAANFPGNPCWYCHDNNVIHNSQANPFRLRQHAQFANRYEKECVYCHMVGTDSECLGCHNNTESLAPQLANLPADPAATWPDGTSAPRPDHRVMTDGLTSCLTAPCHYVNPSTPTKDLKRHNVGAGLWTVDQKADIKNQYMMMGVCLKCHDDDSGDKCTSCHTAPPSNPTKYSLGFDPGTGFIKPQKARASSVHFGYKHNRAYLQSGIWKGGKFCWDCHDPHGDSNIYMIQSKVATSTDGTFGIPQTRAAVSFTRKQSGLDYARIDAPYNGICNVCHTAGSQHYRSDGGDGHNASRICTTCHEHRFTDSHADKLSCTTCHLNKPVPRHSGFGLPRDCTKCHAGTVGKRMDVMGQMNANSHHVQGVTAINKHCYACHWEATPEGLIDVRYHEGYNYKNYSTVKNAKVDLVVWKPGVRPTYYNTTTAVKFLASNIGTAQERVEAAKLTNVCLSCHSDQNNDSQPFNDCRTPRQYAWDKQSIAARYSQTGTAPWGKYNSTTYPNVTKKDTVTKALSAHGNAVANQGGWSATTGLDGTIPNTRGGGQNVECFDCHSSHGSKVVGVTSSYVTFNGTKNGGNLKETQAGKGGYSMSYKASANTTQGAVNPYNAGAGQCFDCHITPTSGTTPWGYQSTFGATAPIKGYMDSDRFGGGPNGVMGRSTLKSNRSPIKGGHLKASSFLNLTTSAQNKINGLCTPCHDPHGVSPTLGADQAYAVPMLKGTWMTSPYKEDNPPPDPYGTNSIPPKSWGQRYGHPGVAPVSNYNIDRTTFGGATRISEDDTKFAGLCLRCHGKASLTDGIDKNQTWKSVDRIHESVKGWGANTEHSYTCSKCHTPHTSGLPRLMITNCLNSNHRGSRVSGGQPWRADSQDGTAHYRGEHRGYPNANVLGNSDTAEATTACHGNAPLNPGSWPDKNLWNVKTPW